MADKQFILDLGKLVIGVAWMDGRLDPAERNALKELLFLLPDISGEDWMHLELYMIHAVTDAERQTLLDRVLAGIRSSHDTDLVLRTLDTMIGSGTPQDDATAQDGASPQDDATPQDASPQDDASTWVAQIRQDLEGRRHGLFAHLTGPLRRTLRANAGRYRATSAREDRMEDFIKNTIYFQLTSELRHRGHPLSLPEEETRKICLAAGLMAHVAWADQNVCHRERDAMCLGLRQLWNVPEHEARLITDMSRTRIMHGLDLVRLTTGFRAHTTPEERRAFVRCLFAIANAAEQTSHDEIEAIRRIATALELPHRDFIDAKLTIPRHDRGGL